jgi:hypothetical protein
MERPWCRFRREARARERHRHRSVHSLKALDSKRPIREADIPNCTHMSDQIAGTSPLVWRSTIGLPRAVLYSDKMKFPNTFNVGTNQEFVGMGLESLQYQPTLNQRVQGSSPCAPTNIFNNLGRHWEERSAHFTERFTVLFVFRASSLRSPQA